MTRIFETTSRELRLSVEISVRYHNRRRSFFDFLHKCVVAVGLIGGSAAFFVIWNDYSTQTGWPREVGLYGALAIAIFHALDLVVGFASMGRLHQSLYQRFILLAADMDENADREEQLLGRWMARKQQIEHDEPSPFHVVSALCRNEVFESTGRDRDREFIHPVPPMRRLFAHFFRQAGFVPTGPA